MIVVSVYMGIRQRSAQVPPIDDEDLGTLGLVLRPQLGQRRAIPGAEAPLAWALRLSRGMFPGSWGRGGFLKVPAMVLFMGSGAGGRLYQQLHDRVTACAGSVVYFARGMVDPVSRAGRVGR